MLSLLIGIALAQDAAAPGVNAHGFEFAPSDGDLRDLLTTWRPERQVKGSFGVDGLFEYADSPLVLARTEGDEVVRDVIVDDLLAFNLGGTWAANEHIAVALSVPLFFASRSADGAQGVAGGDMRLSLPASVLLAEDGNGFDLGVLPYVDLPTGARNKTLGTGEFGGGFVVPAALTHERFQAVANLGMGLNPARNLANLEGGAALVASLGSSYLVTDTVSVRGELRFEPTLSPNRVPLSESPGELLVSGRYRTERGFSATLGGATALTRGATAAAFRIFAGAGLAIGKSNADQDGDGFVDRLDSCPDGPETGNGWSDDDGCPDALADVEVTVQDTDGNIVPGVVIRSGNEVLGTTDAEGKVMVPGKMPGEPMLVQATHFHMEEEPYQNLVLKEGENGLVFEMQWLPGRVRVITRTREGEPILDAKASVKGPKIVDDQPIEGGDALIYLAPGTWDVIVSADSFDPERRKLQIGPDETSVVVIEVTMEPETVKVTEDKVELSGEVHFESAKATLVGDDTFQVLENVANVLDLHPEILKIEVQGHTDSQGGASYNRRLSQARVDSVREWLIEQGISPSRMVAVGYGEDEPIADNDTAEGRAQNRRVEIHILERAGADEAEDTPPPEGE